MEARSSATRQAEPKISVIGIGADEQFAIAREACTGALQWLGTYACVAGIADVNIDNGCILLLDGDTASPDTIDVLDQNAELRRGALPILQTSRADVRLVVSAMKRGVVDVLSKPYTPARLTGAVLDARTRFRGLAPSPTGPGRPTRGRL
ncbi:hypothetical protein [Sphingobium olei]